MSLYGTNSLKNDLRERVNRALDDGEANLVDTVEAVTTVLADLVRERLDELVVGEDQSNELVRLRDLLAPRGTRLQDSPVDRIIADLCDRRGLKGEWALIDPDIQDEIRERWAAIIRSSEAAP